MNVLVTALISSKSGWRKISIRGTIEKMPSISTRPTRANEKKFNMNKNGNSLKEDLMKVRSFIEESVFLTILYEYKATYFF